MLLAVARAGAMSATEGPTLGLGSNEVVAVAFQASAGLLNGTAYERVYEYSPGYRYKLSELIWDLKNVAMVGGVASVKFYDMVQLNFGGWFPANRGSGGMDDYDWMTLRTSEWTDWSTSDVDVERAYVVDVNASVQVFEIQGLVLRGILGYKRDDWKWKDFGGSYIYSSNPDDPRGFRDVRGDFGRETGIIYQQTYDIPYLGAGAGFVHGGFSADAYIRYSPLVQATDVDDHLMRDIHFEGTFRNGDYVGLGARAAYSFAFGLFLIGAVDYQAISEIIGDVDIRTGEGYTTTEKDGGSVEMNATQLSLAAGYRF
jgi:outer membrane protease